MRRLNQEGGSSESNRAPGKPEHLVAVTDASEIAGAESALGELLANLDESVRVTVACVHGEVGRWVAAHRRSAEVAVMPVLSGKADVGNVFKVRSFLLALNANVVHLNKAEVGGLRYVELIARSIPTLRVVSVVHHVEEPGSPFSRVLCRFLANRDGATVAVGTSLARELETLLGLKAGTVVAIPNALAPASEDTIPELPTTFTAGALTRMVSHKRVADLISATASVTEMRLVLGGTGNDLEQLQAHAQSLDVADRVDFLGWVSAEAVLGQIHVYVLASEIEGYPIALLEAQRRGLPVIATNVGGVPEIVNHAVDGFLYEPGDVAALADWLKTLRDNPELRIEMGQAARQASVNRPGPDAMAKAYAGLYWPDQAIG